MATQEHLRNFGDIQRTEIEKVNYYNIRDHILGDVRLLYNNSNKGPVGGFYKLDDLIMRHSVKLNPSQRLAIETAICHELCLIEGPPGTGKTITASLLIKYLAEEIEESLLKEKKNPEKKVRKRILVTADSNKAVDRITEALIDFGVKVARISSR